MADLWSQISWEPAIISSTKSDGDRALAWHKHLVPYVPEANALQTLEVWMPAESLSQGVPDDGYVPQSGGTWVVYIHGGAWRDPAVDATSFEPTVAHLLANGSIRGGIAGLASINYSLSPYPDHCTDPSPPQDPQRPMDPSRGAKHPDHVNDVMHALTFLQMIAKIGSKYLLVGHSCGATLALQVAMDHKRWVKTSGTTKSSTPPQPRFILGLNGLYDLPGLAHHPGVKHEHLVPIYRAFIELAFGKAEDSWRRACPSGVQNWSLEWPSGMKIVLGQSPHDSLVPLEQTGDILERLRKTGASGLRVIEASLTGDHNDIWEIGSDLADLIADVITEISDGAMH